MQIELSNGVKVELIEHIGWGAIQKIQAAMIGTVNIDAIKGTNAAMSGEGLYRGKVKAIELCVVSIADAEGNKTDFSEKWLDTLSMEDGNKLMDAVDAIAKPEKK